MSGEIWQAVDAYTENLLIGPDPVLEATLLSCTQAGLPSISVTPSQGRMLNLLARIHGSRRILEVGTLGGYSTIWLARALPADGRLVTLEVNPSYARLAAENLELAGLAGLVEIRVGPALDTLIEMRAQTGEEFDLVFIDADKSRTPDYFSAALEMMPAGGVIIADNAVRHGAIADADTADEGARGMRRFHELAGGESRVTGTTIQTVGAKGYDGFTLLLVEPQLQPRLPPPGGLGI